MTYRVRSVRPLSERDLIAKLHRAAEKYSEVADKVLMFIFSDSKNGKYDFYEVYFGKHNFMHLAGVKSKTLSALDFYEACLNGTIRNEDCFPSSTASNKYTKISVIDKMLDLRYSKCYKIGRKDLLTKDNDFEMATGNEYGVLGYDMRIKIPGRIEIDKTKYPIPTTLLNNPITDYCAKPYRIIYILQKNLSDVVYSSIFYEIKSGLLRKQIDSLPKEIRSRINIKMEESKES